VGIEVGFFEDYEDEQAIEVGVAGTDESGEWKSFSIQRSTYEPDDQEVLAGMDSYCISDERGYATYGCLRRVRLMGSALVLEFRREDAEIFGISNNIEVDLGEAEVDVAVVWNKLKHIVDWGSVDKRPDLVRCW
jgi:hypothetical protein